MSQNPRGPGGPGWPSNPTNPSPFRPASPFSPTPMSQSPSVRSRGPFTPIHHPISPLTYPGMMHPMSPVPMGMPISPGMSPVFGGVPPSPGLIQCPRPRWPSPVSTGNAAPRPYIPQVINKPNSLKINIFGLEIKLSIAPIIRGNFKKLFLFF